MHARFQEWVQTGALQRAWQEVLRDYDAFVGLDLHWQAGDGCLVKAPLGKSGETGAAEATGRNPTDRGKTGTKRHVLTAANGVPIAAIISEANRTDMKKLGELLDALLVPGPDLPEDAPDEARPQLTLDRGYDYDDCRDTARAHGYVPHIPRRASKDHLCWPKSTSVLIPQALHVETQHSFGCGLGARAVHMGSWRAAPMPAPAVR